MGTIQLSPPAAPFSRIKNPGESITINTAGKILVIPTGNAALLPSFNEYALNSNRLTIAESPFGGLKGAGSPDYGVGTIYTPTDGVYITDTGGTNSTKTMTAGKLKELSLLAVDTSLKTITEEYIISNTNTANSPVNLNISDDITGWSADSGDVPSITLDTGDKTAGTGSISINANAGTGGGGSVIIKKTVSLNLSGKDFLSFDLKSSRAGNLYLVLNSGTDSRYYSMSGAVTADAWLRFNIPLNVPAGANGCVSVSAGFNPAGITKIYIGVNGLGAGNNTTVKVDNINSDVGLLSYAEIQVPDYLSDSSAIIQCWTGAAYQTCRICKLDSTFSDVSTTPANLKFYDGSKVDDVYGSGLGRGVFSKGIQGATVTGNNSLTMTYSANRGTKYRIGKLIKLPPSDSGRTNFNKIRLKIIIFYDDLFQANSFLQDTSGSANKGYIGGAANVAGRNGTVRALSFDGVDDKVTFLTNTNLTNFAAKSVFMWVKAPAFTGAARTIFDGGYWTSTFGDLFQLSSSANSIGVYTKNSAGSSVNKGITITPDTWVNVGYTWDGSTVTYYLNGAQYSTTNSLSGTLACSSYLMGFGATVSSTGSAWYNGLLGSSRIYNRCLSPQEVSDLYNGNTVSDTGLVGKWTPSFLQNPGATAYEFNDSTNASYGLQNMTRPFLALYDPAKSLIDFYLFTHRPKALARRRNDSGEIYELVLYPGNGSIFHGQITFADLAADADSNLIPNCLESAVEGSIANLLSCYDFYADNRVVTFETTGSTFSPTIVVVDAATNILWTFSDGTTSTSATPSINFGSAATRTHTLKVSPWENLKAVNVGYAADDGGIIEGEISLSAKTQQNVSKVLGIQVAQNLKVFAASRNPLTSLDLSLLPLLYDIELYLCSSLTSLTIANLPALKRLDSEKCNLTALDLSGSPLLEQLRTADQTGGHLAIIWGDIGAHLWHICSWNNILNPTLPALTKFPLLEDLIAGGCWLDGPRTLTGSHLEYVDIPWNPITTLTIDNSCTNLTYLYLRGMEEFTQSDVDNVLLRMDELGAVNGTLNLTLCSAPSETGLTYKANLESKGWTVTTA